MVENDGSSEGVPVPSEKNRRQPGARAAGQEAEWLQEEDWRLWRAKVEALQIQVSELESRLQMMTARELFTSPFGECYHATRACVQQRAQYEVTTRRPCQICALP